MYQIRPARIDDLESIVAIIRGQPTLPVHNLDAERVPQYIREQLTASLERPHSDIWVAQAGEHILGYALVHWHSVMVLPGPEGYLAELFVHPDHRGLGVGGSLIRHVEQTAQERGCFRLMLMNAKKRESYERSFYAKQGWTERPEIANFVRLLEAD